MANITGKRYTTIKVEANEVYTVTLSAGNRAVDIVNNTGGNILISETNNFTESASGSPYLTIPFGCGYNGLRPNGDIIYVKPEDSGTISLVVRRV